ncbi:MAG: glycoside hydrolase family 66 protein [Devosia nanyangense]|uniref:Glycoside hydrolase family 66 protein n=1 Tax=Devosia nanyangense TaxID=1228055 RepID=A0A933NYQ1_9HYPH|nr:glycoside hydrolase family 66 protein [Devosia nanyangense]
MTELLPMKASFRPDEPIEIEIRGTVPAGALRVWHLGEFVSETAHDGAPLITLPALSEGGYGIELGELRTAVEVSASPRERLRYGFVANFAPDKNITGLCDTVRRFHLNGVMFYDWAYRHADLMAGGDDYRDPLDQPIALSTVQRLVAGVQAAGSRALGYAAVYAVGQKEWHLWQHQALLKAGGEPYALGDFLFVLDPAAPDWLEHFATDLKAATAKLGFDGYHLDQYGYPKRAIRADGVDVDVADSFVTMIEGVRAALPDAHLVFNNVNDFPTGLTARTQQDAVYIEPWAPQLTLQSLADTVTRARTAGEGKPVVLAAYQHVYESAAAAESDRATALTMATLFSHGGTQILVGEADRLLTDPYYVRNHVMEASTSALLKRWYDFLVAHDELLMPPSLTEVTHSYAGEYNAELDVGFEASKVTETALAGAVWRRIVRAGDRLVVHLVNLVAQTDTLWDAPRNAPAPQTGTLRVRRLKDRTPVVRAADPDGLGRLVDVLVSLDGDYAVAVLPEFAVWQLVTVDL